MSGRLKFGLFICLLIISGCASKHIVTIWKAPPSGTVYSKIMTVAIAKENSDSLRVIAEEAMANELAILGYYGVSSVKEFGIHGLRNLNESAAYKALCDSGIDAVLVLAMVDRNTRESIRKSAIVEYSSVYFYNRIWSYRQLLEKNSSDVKSWEWESILFDLSRLEPKYVIQTRSLGANMDTPNLKMVSRNIVKKIFPKKKTAR